MWAPNPFAIAQLLLPEQRAAEFKDASWSKSNRLVDEAFAIKMETMFAPVSGVPPGLQVLREFMKQFQEPRPLDEIVGAIRGQRLGRALIDGGFGEDKLRLVLPFLVPVSDSTFGRPGARDSQPGQVGIYKPLGSFMNGNPSYLDPKQGMAADCYLISSMIALAWAVPDKWRQLLDKARAEAAADERYRFQMCDVLDDDGRNYAPFDVQPWVPVHKPSDPSSDPSSVRAYFAGPSKPDGPAWPAVVEKAFVMAFAMQQRSLAVEDPAPWHYQWISEVHKRPFPYHACRALIGGDAEFRAKASTPALPLLDPLWGPSPEPESAVDFDVRGVTVHPTMASTQDQTDDMATMGLDWHTAGLHDSHAYALLGRMTQRDADYVVLRNPWGTSDDKNPAYAQDAWRPGPGPNGMDTVVLNQAGVFAIPVRWFEACFSRVDFVRP
jgi:hypothetical protein